ncbi:uncharacterized protein [Euwallacea fornicatus]|uniref:uncharacterized protein n=1 Tax=Euwallacea fornicatus TaxID=995702 RepID=UPI00338DCF71
MLKLALLVITLLFVLTPPLEAKKKPKQTTSITATVSHYVENIKEFLWTAWDSIWDLMPSMSEPKMGGAESIKKKKKKHKTSWNLSHYVRSVSENLNDIYDSVKNSLQMGRANTEQKDEDGDMSDAFFAELIAAEVVEKFTWGLVNIISSNFDNKS